MKKILFWLTLALLIAALTIPVAAAPSASLSASKSTANAGDTVTVKVSVSSLDCKSGGVEVSFDSKVFELTGGKWLLSGAFITDFSTGTKDGVFAFTGSTVVSGNIFELTLKVKDGAAFGKSNVTVKLNLDGDTVSQTVGITVACKHKYDNGCDTTCNKCGEKRSISHDWDSGKTEKRFGFKTTSLTRPTVVSNLVVIVREHCQTICDKDTLEELLTIVKNEKGRIEAPQGCHDDMMMGLAIAHHIRPQVAFRMDVINADPVTQFGFERAERGSDYGHKIVVV